MLLSHYVTLTFHISSPVTSKFYRIWFICTDFLIETTEAGCEFILVMLNNNFMNKFKENGQSLANGSKKVILSGSLGWLSRLSVQLWLRSGSHGLQVQVPLSAVSKEPTLDPLSSFLSAPPLLVGALFLSLKNKHLKKIK